MLLFKKSWRIETVMLGFFMFRNEYVNGKMHRTTHISHLIKICVLNIFKHAFEIYWHRWEWNLHSELIDCSEFFGMYLGYIICFFHLWWFSCCCLSGEHSAFVLGLFAFLKIHSCHAHQCLVFNCFTQCSPKTENWSNYFFLTFKIIGI